MKTKESAKVRYAYGVAMALLLGGTAFSLATGPVGAQVTQSPISPEPGAPASFADLAARVMPAVVNISTKQKITVKQQNNPLEELFRQFGVPDQGQGQSQGQGATPRTREAGSLGSGFIISPDGYVVTNNHLIAGLNGTGTVDSVTVTMTTGKEYTAHIVGRDELADLALLKIDAQNLPYVQWGDSTHARVGDWVLTIGNPYGLGGTVTHGIISALHRGISGGPFDRYIQTDAAINMGNSGGPMFDMSGRVIGINSALISPTGTNVGIGLAIPAEAAKPVIDSLRRGEKPQRGYIGVGLQDVDEDIASSLGLPKDTGEIVRTVQPGTPAANAGMQQGDVIVSVNGKAVTSDQSVAYLIANTPVGSRIPIEVVRNGRHLVLPVTVTQRPSQEQLAKELGQDDQSTTQDNTPAPATSQSLGLSLQPLTPQIAQSLKIASGVRGVVITAVDPNSDASDKGLQRGDVIVSVNQQTVTTPAQVTAIVDAARRAGRTIVLLGVKRGTDLPQFIGVEIPKR